MPPATCTACRCSWTAAGRPDGTATFTRSAKAWVRSATPGSGPARSGSDPHGRGQTPVVRTRRHAGRHHPAGVRHDRGGSNIGVPIFSCQAVGCAMSELQRDVLPIPGSSVLTGQSTWTRRIPRRSSPPIEPLRHPAGAPNVLVVLIDDAGFGCSSAFGGPCAYPDCRAPGRRGAEVQPVSHRPLCARRRVLALLSGGNHHSVGMGRDHRDRDLRHRATTRSRPNPCAPLAETLKLNGYATAQFGKCHEVPVWGTVPLGPFDSVAERR